MGPGFEVEEAHGAVDEAAGQVGVGEGEAATEQVLEEVVIRRVKHRWVEKPVSPCREVPGRPMPIHVLQLPRGPQLIGASPDASREPLPQQIRPRHLSPRGTNLHAQF